MEQENKKEDYLKERYCLAMERIHEICTEETVPAPFCVYFRKTAQFLVQMEELKRAVDSGETKGYTLEQWKTLNHELYSDILPEHYEESFGNPAYAVAVLGNVHGKILSFLYAELRGMIVYAFEKKLEETVVLLELFIEIYNCFEQEELPEYKEIQQIVYWFASDYSELFVTDRIRESVDPSLDFAVRIVMDSDLGDLRYLYQYGEYVSENELRTAEFLNTLSEEEIAAMADTYTEGYRIGFLMGGKDISKKKTVNIRYNLGFERMIRRAIQNFEKMGLQPVIYRAAVSTVNKRQHLRIGYTGAVPNKQFDYDHRADNAIYLDKRFIERKLGVMRTAYEAYKDLAREHGGPAVVEVFGEIPFVPETKADAYRLSEKQQKLSVAADNESAQLTNQYIIGKERSFTIIAFPVPEIGDQFEEIFRETVKINTLDYKLYQKLQQTLIQALDQGTAVHIQGKDGNRTDLTVALKGLSDPTRETLFENCVADVNIPVGEVFTSPKLTGTNGLLHVKQVYLGELSYRDLAVEFRDGMIKDYTCSNFDTPEENHEYFFENVMYHHETLPLGEFAIGTNTTAYVKAKKYGIADKLPILIAEKMGPHFAVGDTCYSWQEDTPVYNADGREIIARDNEVSLLRKEDPAKAYFGCHTDITIPYEEIGHIEVIRQDGSRITLIENGRFVLPGTEELNRPLDEA
ncbi:MAG: aminopeptidase [Lachnospiraceae bacterium]|nr:aminopeptidase [Lachnospiraceae bacterium]